MYRAKGLSAIYSVTIAKPYKRTRIESSQRMGGLGSEEIHLFKNSTKGESVVTGGNHGSGSRDVLRNTSGLTI